MTTGRMEAFSDGVIAILITIMVLELPMPARRRLGRAAARCCPRSATYVLSFVYLGIYWNNHHHMLHAAERVNGAILWANLHLLFWLSLVPFATAWMGENHFAPLPDGRLRRRAACRRHRLLRCCRGRSSAPRAPGRAVAAAVGRDVKGKLSPLLYAAAIALAFVNHWSAWPSTPASR